jgi:hypothetical protein
MILLLRTIALSLGLFGALLASQLPEFTQQYRQRLGGAIDELNRVVARFDADAAVNELTRNDALAKLAQSPDDLVRRRAADVTQNIGRLDTLKSQREAMSEAGSVRRVIYFFRDYDRGVAGEAMKDFEPAIPTSGEGLLATGIGFVGGWGLVQLIAWPMRRWREMRMRRIRLG